MKWRRGDKVPTSAIESIENLAGEPPVGRPDNFPQVRLGCDDPIEPLIGRPRSFWIQVLGPPRGTNIPAAYSDSRDHARLVVSA